MNRWSARIAVALLVFAALAVRLAVATNDFWLDEIWSLRMATDLAHAWQVFTVRHDNNHVLNTLYLRWLGLRDAWLLYRAPAVLAGTGSVALVLFCEPRPRRAAALATAALLAFSYPLVLYGAEARGYAPSLFCALAAFYAVERYWTAPRLAPLLVFWTATALGLLFHAIYVHAYVALLAWSVVRAVETRGRFAAAARALLRCHTVPALMVAAFYTFFVRGMILGGGPEARTADVVRETAAYALGRPETVSSLPLVFVVAFTAIGVLVLRRERSPRWTFFGFVLALVPALLLVVTQPRLLYFRYFLVQILFFYVLAGGLLGTLAGLGRAGAACAATLVATYTALQAPGLVALAAGGRGGCVAAVRYVADQTPGESVVIGSDEHFRSRLVLWYFERFLPPGKRLVYVSQPAWTAAAPDWVFLHDLGPASDRPPAFAGPGGSRYDRAAGFVCGGARRWHWWVYRRAASPSAASPAPVPSPAARPSP